MIRTKLTIVVLVLSIVPLLLSTLFLTNYFNGVTKSDNHQMMQNTADQNIGRIDEWIRLKISAMEELIKSHPEFQGGKPEQLLPLLRTIDESDKQINGFNLIDTKGNAVDTQNVKISVADRAYFKKVQETKKPAISDLLVSKKTGKYVLPLAAPILDSAGTLTGVISATVSPETLTTLATGIKVGNTGSGFIISGKGDY